MASKLHNLHVLHTLVTWTDSTRVRASSVLCKPHTGSELVSTTMPLTDSAYNQAWFLAQSDSSLLTVPIVHVYMTPWRCVMDRLVSRPHGRGESDLVLTAYT